MPDTVEYIGANAFQDCDRLKTITLPDSVEKIEVGAFASCDGLEEIYLGSELRYIGSLAFWDCKNLKTIYFNGTEEEWNAIEKYVDDKWYSDPWDTGTGDYQVIVMKEKEK